GEDARVADGAAHDVPTGGLHIESESTRSERIENACPSHAARDGGRGAISTLLATLVNLISRLRARSRLRSATVWQ
ncbi:MAG: hypothetical protein ACREXY_19435, partial [Gammaproteobacteria bacterium]